MDDMIIYILDHIYVYIYIAKNSKDTIDACIQSLYRHMYICSPMYICFPMCTL